MAKFIKMTPEVADSLREKVLERVESIISDKNKFPDGNVTVTYTIGKNDEKARLNISIKAYLKMQALIAKSQKEVGWHGVAFREDEENNVYRVEDVMVYPQMVDGTNVNTDEDEYYAWNMSLEDDVANNLRFHGHSHVNMGVFASSVDLQHQSEILNMMDDDMFYIFVIMNKRGEVYSKIYDLKKNLMFETSDITISVAQDDLDIAEFLDSSMKLVKDLPVKMGYSGHYQGGSGSSYGYPYGGKSLYEYSHLGNEKTQQKATEKPETETKGGKKKSVLEDGFNIPKRVTDASDYLDGYYDDDDDEYQYGGWGDYGN